MKWKKQGLVYAPSGEAPWARQYALLPTVGRRSRDVIRIYYASLDDRMYGRIGLIELAADDPSRVVRQHAEPVLDIGEPGCFDDCGVNPSCVVDQGGLLYLYYIGWQRTSRVPYQLFAGVAISEDGVHFRRARRTPVLERTCAEPFVRSATSILKEGDEWRCWYVSAHAWTEVEGKLYPEYEIRYAESADGLAWRASDRVCIPLAKPDEFGIGRPWVVNDEGIYRMWYSIRSRSEPYRLGYAESRDGLSWIRRDAESQIPRSAAGWDSEMICYPCVFDNQGRRLMFYNGNRHGATGFGWAVLES